MTPGREIALLTLLQLFLSRSGVDLKELHATASTLLNDSLLKATTPEEQKIISDSQVEIDKMISSAFGNRSATRF